MLTCKESKVIFEKGNNGIDTFRIPVIICTKKNNVFAFAEARYNDQGDAGRIDIVYKKSTDGGKTFGELIILQSNGVDTIGNPAPIYDEQLDRIILLYCFNYGDLGEHIIRTTGAKRDVFCMYTDDEGKTWSEAVNITAQVKYDYYRWYATGPCHGVQMDSGRLIMTCNHNVECIDNKNESDYTKSHIIYSDDHGITWNLGADSVAKTNECCAVKLPENKLMVNMRTINRGNYRCVLISEDEGQTVLTFYEDKNITCPICQASIINYQNLIIFSNPDSVERKNMTVRVSHDYGKTYSEKFVLFSEHAAYSDLAVNMDNEILCLYENGENGPYDRITLATMNYSK